MRRTRLLISLLLAAAVLTAGVTVFATRGPGDAALMIGLVVALAGAYLLRPYARATLIYRRPPLPTGGPRSHQPARMHRDGTGEAPHRPTRKVGEVAAILGERRIGAVPIVNRFDVVVGLMSARPVTIGPADPPPRRRAAAGDRPASRLAGIVTRQDGRLDAAIREEVAHRIL
jgi:hypothetical protein